MQPGEMTPAKKYKDWRPDQPWPEDVPRRVRSTLLGQNVIFYKSQRVRAGGTFTLLKPQDYDPRSMAPFEVANPAEAPTDLERKLAATHDPKTIRRTAQGPPPKSSAAMTIKGPPPPLDDPEQQYHEATPGHKGPATKKASNDVI